MTDLVERLKCLIFGHRWRLSRFVRLGSRGSTYQCQRCKKVVEYV